MASSKTVTVGRVEALEGRVGSLEGNVEGSVGEVAALKERVATLEERLVALEAVGVKKGKAVVSAGGKKERVKKEARPLPEAVEGAPEASEYRLPEEEIQEGVCIGRILNETEASKDRRWYPAVYREIQCGGELADGEELCAKCSRRQDKFAETSKHGHWNGIVTEDPPEWCHMLGSACWAEERKPRWLGEGATDSASEASSVSAASAGGSKPGKKKVAKSAEEKASEKAEKDAKKAAEKAEKAAAAAAEKAAKAAEKEAEKATKAAEKEAAAATKKAEKAASAKKPAAAKKEKVVAPAAAAVAAPAAVAAYTIKMIDGEFYAICGSDVFEYDSMLEEKGALVGHMEGETFVSLAAAKADEEDADAE